MTKVLSIIIVLTLMLSCLLFSVNATSQITVRIEGVSNCFYYENVSVTITDDTTVADVLAFIDENSDAITITGLTDGYITDVNGESTGKFGGWDGWNYTVNDVSPSVGISGYTVKSGDSIVLYYGDYPCQRPVADFSKSHEGVITFNSYDTTYDENLNPTSAWAPVAGATVVVGSDTYLTDDNGQITFDASQLSGFTNVQISKYNASGAPAVCRFSDDFGFVLWDVNGDNLTDINDVTAIQKHIALIITLDDNVIDIDGNDKININDATALQSMLIKMS